MLDTPRTAHKAALRVAVLYALFSALWIGFSDQVLLHFVRDAEMLTRIQMVKGWAFVVVTAFIVYSLLLRELALVKRVERTLVNREKRLNILFDQASDAIFVSDLDGRLIQFNRQACRSTGYAPDELGRLNVIDVDPDMETVERFRSFAVSLVPGTPVTIESRHRRKDGTTFPVEITVALLETPDGPQVLGIARDISERKKLLIEYGRATQLAALGTVAAGVAHEINNPINGVINYATMIRNTPEREERNLDLAKRIIKESERIVKITRDLLHYARDHNDDMQLSDIRQLVEAAVSLVKTNMTRQGIEITTDFPSDLPVVPVYPQGIQQIVINLVDNACDALLDVNKPSGRKEIRIRGSVEDVQDECLFVLEVYDTGTGMSDEVIEQARNAFFSTKPSPQGTGLGLSIVSDIVGRHYGTMDIESREGEYSRFRIFLPIAPKAR